MTFDGTEYRKTVLSTLRDRSPAEVEDVFWLALVPRELDDDSEIEERLKAARGFLFKERSRQRQAAVAQAVLNEWPRVEATLLDRAARAALRRRLEAAPTTQAAPTGTRTQRAIATSPGDRRRRQVSAGLQELARLRDEPELAADLYAFLGLPVTATKEMLAARIERIGEVNRRRRPDRERALVDDLLAHARRLLLDGDPAEYLAGFDDEHRDLVVEALLSGDLDASRTALTAARAHGVSDAAITARIAELGPSAPALVPLSPLGLGVWCPACGAVSPMGAERCSNCMSGLRIRCDACQQLAPADSPRCPNCTALLDDPREPLLKRRAELAEELEAIAEIDAAPAAEHEARLRALVSQHPDWQRAARKLATLPPSPPRDVVFRFAHGEVVISWEPPTGETPTAYLVERHEPGRPPRVLGHTSILTWADSNPAGEGVTWTVRALRGQAASARIEAASASHEPPPPPTPPPKPEPPGVRDLTARPGRPVVLSWKAPPGTKPLLSRMQGDVERRISPDPDGYTDKHVQTGATYVYTVRLEGIEGSERSVSVTIDSTTTVAPPPPRPAPPPAAPSGSVSELGLRRLDDFLVVATWNWPPGTTEVFVAWDASPPASATSAAGGRKVTNTRYEIDGGAELDGVRPGMHLAVFTGSRNAAGQLTWSADATRAVVP